MILFFQGNRKEISYKSFIEYFSVDSNSSETSSFIVTRRTFSKRFHRGTESIKIFDEI